MRFEATFQRERLKGFQGITLIDKSQPYFGHIGYNHELYF